MLIIGERINSSRRSIEQAISEKNAPFLIEQARLQAESGANFVDVNCAVRLKKEKEDLVWLMKILQDNLNIPISIDSPDPEVIDAALGAHKGKPFVNSITAESKKLKTMLDILKGREVFIIALTMDDSGIPSGFEERISIAKNMVDFLKKAGINADNIYVDPLVKPISSEPDQAKQFLEAVVILKQNGIKTIGGLSNVSYGLPARRILNAAFLSLAIKAGIDAVIIDPVDKLIQSAIKRQRKGSDADARTLRPVSDPNAFNLARKALLGEDSYCANYIKAFREGKLNA